MSLALFLVVTNAFDNILYKKLFHNLYKQRVYLKVIKKIKLFFTYYNTILKTN